MNLKQSEMSERKVVHTRANIFNHTSKSNIKPKSNQRNNIANKSHQVDSTFDKSEPLADEISSSKLNSIEDIEIRR